MNAGDNSAGRRRIFSGIQPTGRKHLGNYIGAIRQYVAGQDGAGAGEEAIYCIVDLHATTVAYDPAELRERLYDTTAILLAAGLDPDRCVLFRQGDVREHTELTWLLGAVTAWGDLNRMHQWKTKREQAESQSGAFVSASLFNYPILMAADVLAYRATEVPVGDDQRQHVELMREIARRFNERFGPTLVEPEHRIPAVGARVMDLQAPERKMSKSVDSPQGTVLVLDDPKVIERKFKRAVTDSEAEVRYDPETKPGVSNLLEILGAATGQSPAELAKGYTQYGPLKTDAGEAVIELLAPIQRRYRELLDDPGELAALLRKGADKAREIAAATLDRAYRAIGLLPR